MNQKKKISRSQLEDQLSSLYFEEHKDEFLSLEELKKRASYEYQLQQQHQTKKASISKRMLVVASLAICLLSGSFLVSVLSPTLITNADDFSRRATIWLNDTLHLNIEVPIPLNTPDDGLGADIQTSFASVEEAAAYFDVSLLTLKEGVEGSLIETPCASLGVKPFYKMEYTYLIENSQIDIRFERILETMDLHLFTEREQIETSLSSAFLWKQDDCNELLFIHDNFLIFVSSHLSQNKIVDLLNLFNWIN